MVKLAVYLIFIVGSLYILGHNFLPKNPPPLSNNAQSKKATNPNQPINATSSTSKAQLKADRSSAILTEQHAITPGYKYISVIELIKQRTPPTIQPQPTPQNSTPQTITITPSSAPVLQTQQSTSVSSDPTLSFSPSKETVTSGCNFSLDVNLDTGGKEVDGVDVLAQFDPQKISYIAITSAQIFNGSGVDIFGESYDNNLGSFSFSALSHFGKPLKGSGKIAGLKFLVKSGAAGAADIKFYTDTASVTTSNIIEYNTITNILKTVINANLTIISGFCS